MASSPFDRYWKETRRPIYSAALVFPFFAVYHIGTVFLQTTFINGADALIIRILSLFSVHSMFASALVLLAFFLVWQLRSGNSWSIDVIKLSLMFFESFFFAVALLFVFGWISAHVSGSLLLVARPLPRLETHGRLGALVLFCGAGIYEELLFRGMLLGVLSLLFTRGLQLKRSSAAVWATGAGALLFALFHYVGPAGDSFSFNSFLQRAFGGFYFSVLFVTRGFGVTAACHALYDIIVGLVLIR